VVLIVRIIIRAISSLGFEVKKLKLSNIILGIVSNRKVGTFSLGALLLQRGYVFLEVRVFRVDEDVIRVVDRLGGDQVGKLGWEIA